MQHFAAPKFVYNDAKNTALTQIRDLNVAQSIFQTIDRIIL